MTSTVSRWQPYHEPLSTTLLRTVALALLAAAIASRWMGGWSRVPLLTLVTLWPSFGGHWVEMLFLNWLRPRLPAARGAQLAARLVTWFACGVILGVGMAYTASALGVYRPVQWPAWYWAGLGFIGVELTAHLLLLQARGEPSFYNGRG